MTKMLLWATTAVAFGLAGLVLLAMGWIQRRKPDLITLVMLVFAIWLQTLKIAIYNYVWLTNASLHLWPQLLSEGIDRITLLLMALVSLRHSWLNRTSGTTGIFRQARLAISAFIVAATFLSPIIFKMAAPAWAFANERFILWINLIWLETVALWTVFVDNKRIQADGTRVPYWFATAALTTGIAGTILFRLSDLTPSILIICLSLLLSLTVFVFYGIHSGQIGPKALSGREGNTRSAVAATFGLTARETEIVQLIVDGNSNNEIAQKLFISLKTVESHLYNIFRKMKVTSRVQIVSLILGAKG